MKTATSQARSVLGPGARAVLVMLALAPASAGGAVALGAQARSVPHVSVTKVRSHVTSLQSLPAGLASALRGALARDARSHGRRGTASTTPLTWSQQAVLTAPDAVRGAGFGSCVVISGTTALISSPGWNQARGAVYDFERSGSTWTLQQEITLSGGHRGDGFGCGLALYGTTAAIGAPNQDGFVGAVYIFARSGSGGTWTQQAELKGTPFPNNDEFGYSVGLSANTVLVGTISTSNPAGQGVAYMFTRSGSTWSRQQLMASDGAPGDAFGSSVALSGNTALIGATGKSSNTGAAYLFVRSGSAWSQLQEITPTDGLPNSYFGAVALNGNTAAAGASGKGAVYVYVRSGPAITSTWTLQQEIATFDSGAIALIGNTLVIGFMGYTYPCCGTTGTAYVYGRSGGIWTQQAQLPAYNDGNNARFGGAVGVSGTTALIGANGQNNNKGAAYVFVRD